ncbi:hypothetical protein IKZ77_02150, partial [Candidatus Saccharibacteria bacterium]|nr:hypothetical protein [Candidatus Saccharibacteria bacterium]
IPAREGDGTISYNISGAKFLDPRNYRTYGTGVGLMARFSCDMSIEMDDDFVGLFPGECPFDGEAFYFPEGEAVDEISVWMEYMGEDGVGDWRSIYIVKLPILAPEEDSDDNGENEDNIIIPDAGASFGNPDVSDTIFPVSGILLSTLIILLFHFSCRRDNSKIG